MDNDTQEPKETIRPIQVSCLSDTNESEIVRDEEDGFSSLIGMLGRLGNTTSAGWQCPVGANTR